MQHKSLFDNGKHQWVVFGRDPEKPNSVIDTNEYLIVDNQHGMLLDPGGIEVFPSILSEVSKVMDVTHIETYLCSHQDPDIMSSLALWMALTPKAKIHLSWLWAGFVAHFGNQFAGNFISVPDEGGLLTLGESQLQIVPAHYCHSSGNLNLYDPTAKILFSGDLGSALVPNGHPLFVEDFESHIPMMEGFHTRWLPSNEAKNRWIRRVRKLDVKMLCPQHGSIFKDEDVGKFLDWLEDLDVGRTKE